jgi:hypothetical protein
MATKNAFFTLIGVGIGTLLFAVVLGTRGNKPQLIALASRPASRIFEGFAYAGADLVNSNGAGHISRFLPNRVPVRPMPAKFIQGHYYFFHHPPPADDGTRIAQEILAPRLRAEGFTLTEGANGIFFLGFATWDLKGGGGITTWAIQFKRDQCVAVISYDNDADIRHNPWPVVKDNWDPADYILNLKGRCDL